MIADSAKVYSFFYVFHNRLSSHYATTKVISNRFILNALAVILYNIATR